jgi:hypothetical protein
MYGWMYGLDEGGGGEDSEWRVRRCVNSGLYTQQQQQGRSSIRMYASDCQKIQPRNDDALRVCSHPSRSMASTMQCVIGLRSPFGAFLLAPAPCKTLSSCAPRGQIKCPRPPSSCGPVPIRAEPARPKRPGARANGVADRSFTPAEWCSRHHSDRAQGGYSTRSTCPLRPTDHLIESPFVRR